MTDRETLLVLFDYPPNEGGIARLGSELVNGLAKRGPVRVLTQQDDANGPQSPSGTGISETRVTSRRPLRELATWWELVRGQRAGTVVTGIWYPEGVLALLACRRNVVVIAHGGELAPPEQRWRRPIWARLQRWTLERARLVIANSAYTAGIVHAVAPGADVVSIPLAVDHERFSPGDQAAARRAFGVADPGAVVICSVTRIEAYKGIDVVLRAIAAVPGHQRKRLVYLIGGRGPALAQLQSEAEKLGISEMVRWLGFVPEAELPDLYRAADLFVLCTREQLERRSVEGFGLVFLEAQACGTPVVGTRTGGIPDAIHEDEGGWLIARDDVSALADILSDLVADPRRFIEQGRLARARVEREATWTRYFEAFTRALDEGRHDGR